MVGAAKERSSDEVSNTSPFMISQVWGPNEIYCSVTWEWSHQDCQCEVFMWEGVKEEGGGTEHGFHNRAGLGSSIC